VLVLSVMGIALFFLVGLAERLVIPWHHGQRPRPRQQVVYCASPADGALVGHDLAALVEADRPLAAEPVTRAGLAELSRLAVSDGGLSGMAGRRRPGRGGPPG
jgi:hypothetical protein